MRRTKEITAFSWYGGKTCHLDWLLPIINEVPHQSYIESFGGSAAVLLNKKPCEIEVYNDIHGEVVNFFKVLRTQGQDLIDLLKLTPYSREEFGKACKSNETDPLENARLFFVKARQVRSGLATKATPGRWSYTKKDARRGTSLPISQWFGAIEGLESVYHRILNVQIECLDALDVIQRYDTENALHYIDPPYLMSVRTGGENYLHEYDESQHIQLLNLIVNLKGKFIISGYINELYCSKLKDFFEFKRSSQFANTTLQNGEKQLRQEVIWTNFDIKLTGKGWDETI